MFTLTKIWIVKKNLTKLHLNLQIPPKEAFYSKLNLEDITDKNYAHAQTVWKVFEKTYLQAMYHLCVQCDTLLVADVLENIWT